MRAGAGVLVALAVALGAGGCHERNAPGEYFRLATSGSRFESSNGYVFVVLPDPSAHMVRVDVRYPVGSARDPAGKEGVAHLVEHLLFAVEVPRGSGTTSISAELGRLAYYWNAETALDYTHYVAQGAPASLDGLLQLETERTRVGCHGITPAVFEREKEIVADELKQRRGASGSVLARRLFEALYPAGHPYRRADTVDSVRRIQPADVCRFLRDEVPLGKAIVVVSGAITEAQVRESARRHFASMPQRDLAGLRVPSPVPPAPGRVRLRADVDELTLLAAWPLPARSSREYRLLETVVGDIPDELDWFAELYEWGHSPAVAIIGGHYAPQLVVTVAINSPADADEAIEALGKALGSTYRSVYRAAISDANDRAWRRRWLPVAADLVGQYESIGSRAQLSADFVQFDASSAGLVDRVKDLDRADPEDVRAIAERWLDPDRARFVIIEPDSSATERVTSVSSFVAEPEVHRVSVDPAEADRPLDIPPVHLSIDAKRFRTAHGLTVVVWNRRSSPLVRAALVIDSGTAHDPPGQEGVALLQGADEVYDDQLVFSDADFGHATEQVVGRVTFPLHRIWHGVMTEPQRRVLRARLRRVLSTAHVRYEQDLVGALYGPSHPYARPPLTDASLSRIDGDRMSAWQHEHEVLANATLIVAGDVDRDGLDKFVRRLGEHVREGSDTPRVTEPPVTHAGFVVGAAPDREPLAQLDVAFVGGRGIDRQYALRLMLSQILDAKLAALRWEDALSYGFSASYAPRNAGGMWRVSGKVPPARAADAARILRHMLDAMRASPDAYRAEFVLARRKLVEAMAGSAVDSAAVLERLVLIERFGLRANFFDQLLADIARIRIDELHRFLTSELAAERQVFGAYGPRGSAEAAVAAARGAAVSGGR